MHNMILMDSRQGKKINEWVMGLRGCVVRQFFNDDFGCGWLPGGIFLLKKG